MRMRREIIGTHHLRGCELAVLFSVKGRFPCAITALDEDFLFEQRYHYYYNFLASRECVYALATDRVSIKQLRYRLSLRPNAFPFQYE